MLENDERVFVLVSILLNEIVHNIGSLTSIYMCDYVSIFNDASACNCKYIVHGHIYLLHVHTHIVVVSMDIQPNDIISNH